MTELIKMLIHIVDPYKYFCIYSQSHNYIIQLHGYHYIPCEEFPWLLTDISILAAIHVINDVNKNTLIIVQPKKASAGVTLGKLYLKVILQPKNV